MHAPSAGTTHQSVTVTGTHASPNQNAKISKIKKGLSNNAVVFNQGQVLHGQVHRDISTTTYGQTVKGARKEELRIVDDADNGKDLNSTGNTVTEVNFGDAAELDTNTSHLAKAQLNPASKETTVEKEVDQAELVSHELTMG